MKLASNRPGIQLRLIASTMLRGRMMPRTVRFEEALEEKPSWLRNVLQYITIRQNPDGGYNFAKGVESGAQDTYYALAIFDLLSVSPPNAEATIKWLRAFPADNIYGYFYIARSLIICGQKVEEELITRILSLRRQNGGFGGVAVDIEAYSEFEPTYMATEVLSRLHIPLDKEPIQQWILSNLNSDGGFGGGDSSNITSTFHAVASLRNLEYPVRQLSNTLQFLRSCEKPRGGFTAVPRATLPYVEDTYAGVTTLDLMGEKCLYPEATASFTLNLQNSNGGFRRSIELGISTFENTYYALSILRRLGAI